MDQDRAGNDITSSPVTVFISYAHEDEELKNKLCKHLRILQRGGLIAKWHDRKIIPGSEWSKEVDKYLEAAQLVLLLVSADFIDSDYCYDTEVKLAIERHERGEARVVPVLLRPCHWKEAPFGKFHALPTDAKPVVSWPNEDDALTVVTEGIRAAAESLRVAAERSRDDQKKFTALHQLPQVPHDFTGRDSELADLINAINEDGANILAIQGLGGVGKTSLALKLAHQLKSDYPDGQFYIDLNGASPKPLAPEQAMLHILSAHDLRADLPDGPAKLAALYQSVLHRTRALLLMDNARDAQQIEPLIPPSNCLLLITSRQRFTLAGMVEKSLDTLPPDDSSSLLLRIAPRLSQHGKDCVADLSRLCGYVPLALRTVGSALKVQIHLDPASYAQRLTDARERLKRTAADASLELSYELLPEQLQKRFRLLALFPSTFDLAAAAAVWGVDKHAAEDSLGDLLGYSLVSFDEASMRYYLHNLVQLFGEVRLESEERLLGQRRHAEHYFRFIDTIYRSYVPSSSAINKDLELFQKELSNLHAAEAWSAVHAKDDAEIAEWAQLYAYKQYLLMKRQHPRQRLVVQEAMLAAMRRSQDRPREGLALGYLGIAYYELGLYRHAISSHLESEQVLRSSGYRMSEARVKALLAVDYAALGDYTRAIEYGDEYRKIYSEVGDRLGECFILRLLGEQHDFTGEYDKSAGYYEKCLQTANEINDDLYKFWGRCGFGIALYGLGEHTRALEHLVNSLQIARAFGYRIEEALALTNLGISHGALGSYQKAMDYLEESLRLTREIEDRKGEGDALFGSSLVLHKQGDTTEAIARAEAALSIFEQIESPISSKVRTRLAEWSEGVKTG